MKVVLTQTVPNLGAASEIINVKPGFAKNFLFPEGLAMPFSAQIAAELEAIQAQKTKARDEIMANSAKFADQISKITLTFTLKASAKGVLFGSVTPSMIASELETSHKIALNPSDIILPSGHIKEIGSHIAQIKLADQMTELKIQVKAEK